jgi:S-adenosylmethionine-diacylgycerolhomoserine-N-methlytransferase
VTGAGGHHAVLMDRVYRHQRHIYDLTRRFFLFGRDRLLHDVAPKPGDRIVEIGCGTARNLIRLARRSPGVRLYGIDASHEMLRTAQRQIARQGLTSTIEIAHALAEEFSPQTFSLGEKFDHVFFSYSLSMIPDWRAALRAAAAASKPEGRVHIVDFADLAGLWRPVAKGLRAWLRKFHVMPRHELIGALAGLPDARVAYLRGRYALILQMTPAAAERLATEERPAANRQKTWQKSGNPACCRPVTTAK